MLKIFSFRPVYHTSNFFLVRFKTKEKNVFCFTIRPYMSMYCFKNCKNFLKKILTVRFFFRFKFFFEIFQFFSFFQFFPKKSFFLSCILRAGNCFCFFFEKKFKKILKSKSPLNCPFLKGTFLFCPTL